MIIRYFFVFTLIEISYLIYADVLYLVSFHPVSVAAAMTVYYEGDPLWDSRFGDSR
jgi:hypothetical protein